MVRTPLAPRESHRSDGPGRKEGKETGDSTIERLLTVLELMLANGGSVTASDLMGAHHVTRSTAHRYIRRLVGSDLLEPKPVDPGHEADSSDSERTSYGPGFRLRNVCLAMLGVMHAEREITAILERVSDSTGETCFTGVLTGTKFRVTNIAECTRYIRSTYQVGIETPAHATATGKLALAHLPDRERDSLLKEMPLPRLTRHTITKHSALLRECEAIRRQGFALNLGELDEEVAAIAVPALDGHGRLITCLGLVGPRHRLDRSQLLSWRPLLEEAAARMGLALSRGLPD